MRQLLRLGLALLLCASCASSQGLDDVASYAEQLAKQRLFAGMLHVDQGGATVFSKGFGLANYELDVPMRNDHRYPIGSNTKLFTAVAIWQLHRAGKLSVYDPAAKYLNATELGLDGPWCPRVYGAPDTGPCQQPQIQHLLRMSGGIMGFDNCAYKPAAWQQQYCLVGSKSPANWSFDSYQSMQLGATSIAGYLRLTGTLRLPLEFERGSQYHYSNPGYSVAGYIVEQVSGMRLADYFRTHIFEKHSLSSSLYDPTNGAVGLHKRMLPFPAYISYLQPGQGDAIADTAGATLQQLEASAGSRQGWGGDISSAADSGASVGRGSVSVGMTAKYPGPSGFDWTLANAAGALVSTPQDMAKWFRALLADPDHLGLGRDLITEFLTLSTDVAGMPVLNVSVDGRSSQATLAFAQGLVVMKSPNHPRGLGVSSVYYLGSLGAFQASMYMWLHPRDPSKDVFINAVAATVLPAQADWPDAAQNLTGKQCQQDGSPSGGATSVGVGASSGQGSSASVLPGGRRLWASLAEAAPQRSAAGAAGGQADVWGVLCELSNMVPSAVKTVPDLLARKAFKGLTGREWFNVV